jgi:hypothetical protein
VSRLRDLGAEVPQVEGVEIHHASALEARRLVREQGGDALISVGDFLASGATGTYDAVIGNPPFVRYQELTGEARGRALRAALEQGVVLPRLTNSWAPFVVHSSAQLKPDGRLALVVPAELLSAGFAAEVRRFLLRRFRRVRLVLADEAIFPGVLTDAILLFAEGSGGTREIEVVQVRQIQDLDRSTVAVAWEPPTTDSRWVHSLITAGASAVVDRLQSDHLTTTLRDWGTISLGGVTGSNQFFTVSANKARHLHLGPEELTRISPPGSGHLRSFTYSRRSHDTLLLRGAPGLLFRPQGRLSRAAHAYVKLGEAEGVDTAYKCRVRQPWWLVPLPRIADLLITYMNGDTPRLVANLARVRHLNSVHGLYLRPELKGLEVPLAVASLNSATLLGAELVGRAYGGGILKLEPGEALALPLPSVEIVRDRALTLKAMLPRLRRSLAASGIVSAAVEVDEVLFGEAASSVELEALRSARLALADRRTRRGISHRRRGDS